MHAFLTSEILRTKYDREITTEKEAKGKQSNEHFALHLFTSLTSVVFLLLQKWHRNVKTCICMYISNSSTPYVYVYKVFAPTWSRCTTKDDVFTWTEGVAQSASIYRERRVVR